MSTNIVSTCLPDTPAAIAVRGIAAMARDAGGRALLVGGCVRDAIRGICGHDYDLEVYGIPSEKLYSMLSSRFSVNKVGMSFGVMKIGGLDIDVSLPRRESKTTPGHRGFLVDTISDLPYHEACARRDFTINAILADPITGEIIDPFKGMADIENHIIRHVSDHFSEDPLRVLRAMQFSARFEYNVAPETIAVCSRMTPENLPAERLAGEWEKLLLKGTKPSLGLAFLRDCGWIRHYPELAALVGCPQHPAWHPEGDVWTHTMFALDWLPNVRKGIRADDILVAVSVLCHDFGKPDTTAFAEKGKITSYGHEKSAETQVRSFIKRLWNMPDFEDAVVRLVATHMRPVALVVNDASDKAYRKLAVEARRLDLLADVVECDMNATPPNGPDINILRKFRERAEALAVAKEPPRPLIQGRDLIARGLTPGPEFGKILSRFYERQINGDFTDKESADKHLDRFLKHKHQ